jgi:hypothetical protein
MKIRSIYYLIILAVAISSCNNDEEITVALEPPRALSEVQIEDDKKIQDFLATNFYNYEEFQNPPQGFNFRIKIDSIKGDNANKRPLSEFIRDTIIELTTVSNLGASDVKVAHKLYYLIAREGSGEFVTPYDSIYHKYDGSLLNGNVFDSTNDNYIWIDVPGNIRGFSAGIAKLKTGSAIVVNDDGTTDIENSGIGMIILPSALAYYNAPPIDPFTGAAIFPEYSPLIFKLEVGLDEKNTDSDRDGIPNRLEDLNNNGYLRDENTDNDFGIINGVRRPLFNYLDSDDDGDNKLTRDEIIINADGSITFPDTDGDGIPDYLDKDS